MIQRNFNLHLHAGHKVPLVINVNQYDSGEQWLFTLYNGAVQYTPSSGAIVGIKSDRLGIINSGTVDSAGRVVINETQQMTAAAGKAVFELLIDGGSHGTANFIVLVEPKPGDQADLSDSDLSLIQEAINSTTPANIASAVSTWMDENLSSPTNPVVDSSLTVSGAAADSKKTGDEISSLKSAIAQGSGLTNEAKTALLELLQHVAYADDDGQDYYDALETALNPPTNLSYITAVYTQSGTVYPSTSLNSLKSDLVVTAHYSDLTTSTVSSYTLSGTLSEGTSVVTVTYSGKTTTFNVTVTAPSVTGWYYPFNGSLLSAGTKDFGFTGTANYTTGFDTRQAYLHRVGTEADSSTDVTAIKATGVSEYPDMSGDFTMSFWHKSFTNLKGHPVAMSKYLGDTIFTAGPVSASSSAGNGWTISHSSKSSQKYCGFTWWWYSNQLIIGIQNSTATTGNQLKLTPPSGFSTLTWHHYALTRSGNNMYFFVDGVKQATMTVSGALYSADQITVGSLFKQSAEEATNVMAMSNGDVVQDLYISETCKWTADFDPTAIVYD